MKRLLLSSFFLTLLLKGYAQTDSIPAVPYDSIAVYTADLIDDIVTLKEIQNRSSRYKIYPTENIYNLLKLDSQTGKIVQIQWSLELEKEFTTSLNSNDLSLSNSINSFELYPTKNMYQFILLDKASGRTWHVQWGTKPSERWIRRIY